MSDSPVATQTHELAQKQTIEMKALLRRASNWFWNTADGAKDMDTKPFEGIL